MKRIYLIGAAVIAVVIIGMAVITTDNKPTASISQPGGVQVGKTYKQSDLFPDQSSQSKETVVFEESGSGIKQTTPFTTSSHWRVEYQYDCGSSAYPSFQVYVKNTDGSYNSDVIGKTDNTAQDSSNFYDSGEHYLEVNSMCNWHVKVVSQ